VVETILRMYDYGSWLGVAGEGGSRYPFALLACHSKGAWSNISCKDIDSAEMVSSKKSYNSIINTHPFHPFGIKSEPSFPSAS
jgi:hypothetical protein